MHHVSRVAVEGFWDTHDFKLQLFPQVTFLIGQNGTGKTTLINLLAAALTADFRTLYRIAFRKITITLDSVDDKTKVNIIVSKGVQSEKGVETIDYHIKSPSLDYKSSTIPNPEPVVRRVNPGRYIDAYRSMALDLNEKLRSLVEVNWISVNRMPILERMPDELRVLESAVDLRLDSISNRLVRYLSKIAKEKDDEVRQFQQALFISLIDLPQGSAMFDLSTLSDLDKSVEALSGIFRELNVDEARFSSLLDKFKKTGHDIATRDVTKSRKRTDTQLTIDEAAFLYGLRRVSGVVERWYELQKELAQIFNPREKFLRICNELLQRKQLELLATIFNLNHEAVNY